MQAAAQVAAGGDRLAGAGIGRTEGVLGGAHQPVRPPGGSVELDTGLGRVAFADGNGLAIEVGSGDRVHEPASSSAASRQVSRKLPLPSAASRMASAWAALISRGSVRLQVAARTACTVGTPRP